MIEQKETTSEDRFNSSQYKTALQEYFHIEEQIDKFDERSLKMKSWSITTCVIIIGAGFHLKLPVLFLVASASVLIFWYLEAVWKYFQYALTPRIKEVEAFLNNETLDGKVIEYTGPRINKAFSEQFKWKVERRVFPGIFFIRNIQLPHSLIFIIGIILYFLRLWQVF